MTNRGALFDRIGGLFDAPFAFMAKKGASFIYCLYLCGRIKIVNKV